MIISPTVLAGVMVVELEPAVDPRGSWLRTFDADVFLEHGLDARVRQCGTSLNRRAGTVRGLHYQLAPHAETKLVRCVKGRIFDVVVDLREGSPTHKCWMSIELSAGETRSLLIGEGYAHGFQTLDDDTEVHYQMTTAFAPDAYRGVRWDDPAFSIEWPEPPPGGRIISERDRSHPDYER
jgi:dTDP-4-dehydrorhamnose 3,5-epimerase